MGKIGYTYGSEWHLLRWMGRHRKKFNQKVIAAIGSASSGDLDWVDFNFSRDGKSPDAELKGLDFVQNNPGLLEAWSRFWPQGRGIHNWDSVAWRAEREVVLVEAKAHKSEIYSDCTASSPESIKMISNALRATAQSLGVANFDENHWMKRNYQLANRLAIAHFLKNNGYTPHLLFIYLTGDKGDSQDPSPQTGQEWEEIIRHQLLDMGINPENDVLQSMYHKCVLPVRET
jgi:hypothetical protein